uniref:DUF4781 domain-containing protein n=1 Tax=Panagrolaimus davidi TaxID=227884 RepID=A0A914QZK7_9BILA
MLVAYNCFSVQADLEDNSKYELQLEKEYEELIRDVECESLGILSMYSTQQRRKAKQLTKKIVSLEKKTTDRLYAAIIFVCILLFDSPDVEGKILPIPVIRILKESGGDGKSDKDLCWFVDLEGRAYKSWEDYLSDNKLPRGEICFPIDGIYSTRPINKDEKESAALLLDNAKTPACKLVKKIVSATNTAMTVASFGSLAIAVAGMAITVTPVVAVAGTSIAAASMIYGGTRSVSTLVDRGIHKQTLAPKDAESRGAWIGIAGVAFTAGSAHMTQILTHMAAYSNHVGKSMEYTTNFVNSGAIGVGAVGVVNQGYSVLKGFHKDQTFSTFALMQLSLSALLFTHSLVNFETAKSIIHKSKNHSLSEFENTLNGQKSRSDLKHVKQAAKGIKLDTLKRQKSTIRTVRQIDDPRDFFHKAYQLTDGNDKKDDEKFGFNKNGNLFINDTEFSAKNLSKLNKNKQDEILEDLNLLKFGRIKESEVASKIENWINASIEKEKGIEKIIQELPKNKESKMTLKILKLHIPALSKILEAVNNFDDFQQILSIAIEICESMGFQSPRSLFQIIVIIIYQSIKSDTDNQQSSDFFKMLDNSFVKNEIYDFILDFYLKQINSLDSNLSWKYLDIAQAKHDFKNYNLTMKNVGEKNLPLRIRDYWQKLQEFFDKTKPIKDKQIDEAVDPITYENDKYKGAVLCFQLSDEIMIKSVLYFHRKDNKLKIK